ncbi:MAG: hypothetical protein WCC90_13890 [Methylocella sp.]
MTFSKLIRPHRSPIHAREEHWILLSDLTTGLFMIKVEALMRMAEHQAQQMKKVAVLYDETRQRLYADLESEFRADLPRWKASLDRDLAIRFEEPDVLFDVGNVNN